VLQMEGPQFSTSKFFEPAITPELGDPGLGRLLSLFPNVASVHVPVRVALPARAKGASEKSTIQFGISDTAIFNVSYPLNCGEAIRVKPSVGSGEVPAVVVAMMPKAKGATVAVRFLDGVPRWFARA
jgi:hypothetical protein